MAAPPNALHGRLWILAAAVLWSSSALFVKSTMFEDWPAETRGIRLAFWRALFAGLLLVPAVRRPRLRPAMLPMVLCFTGMGITYLSAMTVGTAANAIWLQNTAPLWVMLVSVKFLGEPFARRDALTFALVGAGLLVILVPGMQEESSAGVMLGLAAGVCYAVVVLLLRALRAEDGAWLVVLNHLGAAVLMAPYVLGQPDPWPSAAQLATLVLFGFIQMGLAYFCFTRGLRTVPGPEAAVLALVEPLLVPLWAYLVASELPAGTTVAGAALILAGLLYQFTAGARARRLRSATDALT